MKTKRYSAKILLFGEYGILMGGEGLAIPYPRYNGAWCMARTNALGAAHITASRGVLYKWVTYLHTLADKGNLPFVFDFDLWKEELRQGLFFDSNIAQGCGLGSSGALVAALYERYARPALPPNPEQLPIVQKHLACLENFFHHQSSGLDPLLAYANNAVWLRQGIPSLPTLSKPLQEFSFFLYDSQLPRHTAPLVNSFVQRQQTDANFAQICHNELLPYNKHCIAALLAGDVDALFEAMYALSKWQFQHLRDMIPNTVKKIWEEGLISGDFCLKLCGAGGGGYFIGMERGKTGEKMGIGDVERL